MTDNARPILSLKPSTEPSTQVYMEGSPAEFTVVDNPYVRLHLGKSSMGIQVKSRRGDSEWITVSFIDMEGDGVIGILNPTNARIYPKETK